LDKFLIAFYSNFKKNHLLRKLFACHFPPIFKGFLLSCGTFHFSHLQQDRFQLVETVMFQPMRCNDLFIFRKWIFNENFYKFSSLCSLLVH